MIDRIRVLVLLSRPPVLILLGLFAATGMAQAGGAEAMPQLAHALVIVAGFLLFSVVVNDLADEAIDRVNLPGDRSRPLVTGAGTRSELPVVAFAAAVVAIVGAAVVGPVALAVVVGGLALSTAYSLRPVRLADRGAVAALLLPAGYVAVPYLLGLLIIGSTVSAHDLVLLGGLYLGFIGRILLKDFRDVRGDALFGKRTFLVRHGRRWTCLVSGTAWVLGSIALVGVRGAGVPLVLAQVVWVAVALSLLRALSVSRHPRRDEALISAIAILGRGMLLTVIAHLGMTDARWPAVAAGAALAAIVVVCVGQAVTMARNGPTRRLRVPETWASMSPASAETSGWRQDGGSWVMSPPR